MFSNKLHTIIESNTPECPEFTTNELMKIAWRAGMLVLGEPDGKITREVGDFALVVMRKPDIFTAAIWEKSDLPAKVGWEATVDGKVVTYRPFIIHTTIRFEGGLPDSPIEMILQAAGLSKVQFELQEETCKLKPPYWYPEKNLEPMICLAHETEEVIGPFLKGLSEAAGFSFSFH